MYHYKVKLNQQYRGAEAAVCVLHIRCLHSICLCPSENKLDHPAKVGKVV